MGLVGWIVKRIFKWSFYILAFSAVLVLLPGFPPYVKFTAIESPKVTIVNLTGENTLKSSSREHVGKLTGPEAFQIHNGELYTSLCTGEIVKLTPPGHITFITKIGKPCEGPWQSDKCGRPLGFRIDEAGKYVYVVDAYFGIWKVDIKTDRKEALVTPRNVIENRSPKLFNSIALGNNGDFYWTESSSDFALHDGVYTTLADPSGRLFHYDASMKMNKVLMDGLWFANGVAVSPNEDFVIVAETLAARIWKVYVNGPKKGQKEIFADALPGTPDNIQPLPDKTGILVGLYAAFDSEKPFLTHSLAPLPLVRKLAARVMRLVEIPFEFLNQQFPHYAFEMITHNIGSFASLKPTLPSKTGFARLDWSGKIVDTWFLNDKSAEAISDAIVFNNKLYLGSPINNYVGVTEAPASLIQAFKNVQVNPPKKNAETMTEQIPKDNGKPIVQAKAPVEEPKVVKTEEKPKQATMTKETPKPTQKEAPKVVKKETPKPAKEEEPKVVRKESPSPAKKDEPRKQEQAKPAKVESPPQAKAPETKSKKPEPAKKEAPKKDNLKKEIPIKEDIIVDTKNPVEKPLKVITKDGPAEIPNRNA